MIESTADLLIKPGEEVKGSELTTNFLKSEEFLKLQGVLEAQMKQDISSPDKYRRAQIKGEFAGACFERLGYSFLKGQLMPGHYLASPQETLAYFQEFIYPQRDLITRSLFETTLSGVYIPDGLVFEGEGVARGRLRAIVDYTMTPNARNLERKLAGLEELKTMTPTVFSNAQLIVVSPITDLFDKVPKDLKENPDLGFEFFPYHKLFLRKKIWRKYHQSFKRVFGEKC